MNLPSEGLPHMMLVDVIGDSLYVLNQGAYTPGPCTFCRKWYTSAFYNLLRKGSLRGKFACLQFYKKKKGLLGTENSHTVIIILFGQLGENHLKMLFSLL